MMARMVIASDVGWKAWAALGRAAGRAELLAPLSESLYATAAGEILWVGRLGGPLHCRAVLARRPPRGDGAGAALQFDLSRARLWRPPRLGPSRSPATIAEACGTLCRAVSALGQPRGLGALLIRRSPEPLLARAVEPARALARACVADDPGPAREAALALLGLGPGLTPAGDDYLGGAFFALRLLRAAGAALAAGWDQVREEVIRLAPERTHPVSVALLGDLLAGEAHAPLHDLAGALAAGAATLPAARRLVRIGHSSGWDLLAGFVAGLLGEAAFGG